MTTALTTELRALLAPLGATFQNVDLLLGAKIIGYFSLGIALTLYLRRTVTQMSIKNNISAHHTQIIRRLVFYTGVIFSIIIPFNASGINVTTLLGAMLGAAGLMTAAVAFAAQTSISNFLSGVFLLAEKPFQIGDYIVVNDRTGEVLSIDLLSVKIRTKDNVMVRIPNEYLLKAQFDNLSRFPIRRCTIQFKVAFQEDLNKIKRILFEVAKQNPLCLVSPSAEFSVIKLGESSVQIQFSVWSKQSTFSSLETNIQAEIQAHFIQHSIVLPTAASVFLESA